MSSILDNPAVRERAVLVSVENYHALGEAGLVEANTELLHGVIVEKMVKSPEHSWLVQWLVDWLRESLPAGFVVRQEQPLTCSDSEPEPDIAVVRGGKGDFRREHPRTAALVIEVALWSEPLDREKAGIYAAAGVDQYWLVLPHQQTVEALSQPTANGYKVVESVGVGGTLVFAADPAVQLPLAKLFDAGSV